MPDEREDLPQGEPRSEPGSEPRGAPEGHADDGLDLARSLARSTAKATPARRRPRARRADAPGKASGAHPDDRDPQTLDASLERLVADHGWDLDLRVQAVFGRWVELVGADVARHSAPESLSGGVLVVRTDSTAWATQLRLLAPSVVHRLNAELGHGTVARIDVLGPHLPSWRKGRRSARGGRGPRDTYG